MSGRSVDQPAAGGERGGGEEPAAGGSGPGRHGAEEVGALVRAATPLPWAWDGALGCASLRWGLGGGARWVGGRPGPAWRYRWRWRGGRQGCRYRLVPMGIGSAGVCAGSGGALPPRVLLPATCREGMSPMERDDGLSGAQLVPQEWFLPCK